MRITTLHRLVCWAAVVCASVLITPQVRGAFHLWQLQEIYTDSSGTLQFIEMFENLGGGEVFVGGLQITVQDVGNTQTHTFTLPQGDLEGSTFNHALLFGTDGLQAAGGPAPDYIIPNNFLFPEGGTISFFGLNSGPYSALPTDGSLSRIWASGQDALNSPQNFAGQIGTVLVVGDFDQDNRRTVADVSAMMSALADLAGYQTSHGFSLGQMKRLGDINGNDAITNADLQALINILANDAQSMVIVSAVPEPTSVFLLICGASLTGVRFLSLRRCARAGNHRAARERRHLV